MACFGAPQLYDIPIIRICIWTIARKHTIRSFIARDLYRMCSQVRMMGARSRMSHTTFDEHPSPRWLPGIERLFMGIVRWTPKYVQRVSEEWKKHTLTAVTGWTWTLKREMGREISGSIVQGQATHHRLVGARFACDICYTKKWWPWIK